MILSPNKFSTITVSNSITNSKDDEKFDTYKPFTFIEFLNYSKTLTKTTLNFTDYQNYLKTWNTVTEVSYVDLPAQVRIQFIDFLKTISLNFTTAKERRFLTSIDYTNNDEMEVAVPFFVEKIKQVILYYANKRDTYKIDFEASKNKGSIAGVESYLKSSIVETLFSDDVQPEITLQQPLSTINNILKVEVEGGYDIQNNYFDLDPQKPGEFYNAVGKRLDYFTANTNVTDPNLFVNYDQAIIDLINSEGVVLTVLQNLVVNINTPDVQLLQDYDFINYSSKTRDNLKLIFNAELIQKFTGTNFYYVSTNSIGQILSGMLFEAASPFANLLNLHSASTLTVPDVATLYERDVGLFFKPTSWSMLSLQTPFSQFFKEQLPADTVFVFPDPNSYGDVSGVSKVSFDTPLNFNLDGQKIQKNISSNGAIGNSYVTNHDNTFESYLSIEQNNNTDVLKDLYNSGVVSSLVSDVYGNLFVGLKQLSTNYINEFEQNVQAKLLGVGLNAQTCTPYLSSIKTLTLSSFEGTETSTLTSETVFPEENNSIYYTRNSIGNFVVYNVHDDTIYPFNTAFNNVIDKYPQQSFEIQNNLTNIEVYGSTYVFTTENVILLDEVVYDNSFYKSNSIPLVLSATNTSKFSNVYMVGSNLYIATYGVVMNSISGTNERQFELKVYSYDLPSNTFTLCEFSPLSSNIFSFNANTKFEIENVVLSYNSKTNYFNAAVGFKDVNRNISIHSIYFKINTTKLNVVDTTLYTSTNQNFTINFYSLNATTQIYTQTIVTSPGINITNGTIIF